MTKLRKIVALTAVLLVALAPALVLAADPAPGEAKGGEEKAAAKAAVAEKAAVKVPGPEGFSIYLGVAFGSGMIILGAAYGISRIGSSSVENMARQPEVADSINKAMIVAAALIEGVTFFALIVCLVVAFRS